MLKQKDMAWCNAGLFKTVSRIVSGIRFVSDDGKKAEEWYGKTSRLLDKTLITKLKSVNMEELK